LKEQRGYETAKILKYNPKNIETHYVFDTGINLKKEKIKK